jgi:hypothetical protein
MSQSSTALYNLKAKGKVVWTQDEREEFYCGISFIEIADNDRGILSAFISKYREI